MGSIGEPRHIFEAKDGEGVDYAKIDAKKPEELTEEEKTAILGRPCLGPNSRIQIRIRESKEFASSVDKMMQKANNSMMQGSSSWLEQFTDALTVQVDEDEEEGEDDEEAEEKVLCCDPSNIYLQRIPNFCDCYYLHRSLYCCYWRCRWTSWLLHQSQRLCQCYCLRCPWNFCP